MILDSELISLKDQGEFQVVHCSRSRLKIITALYMVTNQNEITTLMMLKKEPKKCKKIGGIIFRVYPGYSEASYWGAPFQPLFPYSQQHYMSRYHFYQAVRRELHLAWGNHEHILSIMCMRILINIACEFVDFNDPQCKDQPVRIIVPHNLGRE